MPNIKECAGGDTNRIYFLLFFLSGFPALLYQIVWQRALFTLYGVNIESVTMIVTVFMLGLGLGSLAGGWLSSLPRVNLLLAFGLIEFSVGTFGAVSLTLFHWIGSFTAGVPAAMTGLIAFALLLIPTLLMGSTLPLLVEHFVRRSGNVGESVGLLYAVNTLGSGTACFAAALVLMRWLGESGSVRVAVCFNLLVAAAAFALQFIFPAKAAIPSAPKSAEPLQTIPLRIGMLLAGLTGFIALASEILWYRLYSFVSGGTAACFATLLGFYLFGIAYGSFAVRDVCKRQLQHDVRRTLGAAANVVLLGSLATYLLGPALGRLVTVIDYRVSYIFVFIGAALLGSAFPLLAHAAIDPVRGSGKHISFLYLSNIIGSTLGSFLVGFVILDHLSTGGVSLLLLTLGFATASLLAYLSWPSLAKRSFAVGAIVCVVLGFAAAPLYSNLYERLLFKRLYHSQMKFSDLVEDRSGVIAVYPDDSIFGYPTRLVYGNGVYDGQINTNILHDSNGIERAYAVFGMHPKPANVLIIGLSTGAWAQVIANNPDVHNVTIVEIDRGYLGLIRKYPQVQSLLTNPKVHITIDDGRRWLLANPNRRFDLIVMNTTFNWRANATNLLSKEFLALVRTHLAPGGIGFYNTTSSSEATITGASVFPYALRFENFLAVGDSPFTLDKTRWKAVLEHYSIDGEPVFDHSKPDQLIRLENVVNVADHIDQPGGILESRDSLRRRLKSARPITDDNMGTEWQQRPSE